MSGTELDPFQTVEFLNVLTGYCSARSYADCVEHVCSQMKIFLDENDDVPVDNVDMCVDKIGAHGIIVLGIGAGDSKRKPQPAFLGPWKYKHFFCETKDKFPSPTNLHSTMQRAVQMAIADPNSKRAVFCSTCQSKMSAHAVLWFSTDGRGTLMRLLHDTPPPLQATVLVTFFKEDQFADEDADKKASSPTAANKDVRADSFANRDTPGAKKVGNTAMVHPASKVEQDVVPSSFSDEYILRTNPKGAQPEADSENLSALHAHNRVANAVEARARIDRNEGEMWYAETHSNHLRKAVRQFNRWCAKRGPGTVLLSVSLAATSTMATATVFFRDLNPKTSTTMESTKLDEGGAENVPVVLDEGSGTNVPEVSSTLSPANFKEFHLCTCEKKSSGNAVGNLERATKRALAGAKSCEALAKAETLRISLCCTDLIICVAAMFGPKRRSKADKSSELNLLPLNNPCCVLL